MKVIESVNEWRNIRKSFVQSHQVGFVPTMGNLHQGHASLLNKSQKDNDISVLSIFINPTQFNDKDDFEKYPKTIDEDIQLAKECGVDFIFLPQAKELYFDEYHYQISEDQISTILEGKHRPGHFEGVLTVVMKLFNLVKPQRAYFGEKDYQQLMLIKGMVAAFFLDIEIVNCPTVRLPSGLAMSSRNNLLSESQLKKSEGLSRCLSGENEESIKLQLEQQGFDVEYVEKWNGRLLAAVKIGNVRLIDNVKIDY